MCSRQTLPGTGSRNLLAGLPPPLLALKGHIDADKENVYLYLSRLLRLGPPNAAGHNQRDWLLKFSASAYPRDINRNVCSPLMKFIAYVVLYSSTRCPFILCDTHIQGLFVNASANL